MLKIDNLIKQYPNTEKPAVNGLELHIAKGSIHGLLGPNGAGKTTTIKIISGLSRFDSGTVEIGGFNLKNHPFEIKKLIGFVPQDIALYQELSAIENLHFFAGLHRLPKQHVGVCIDDALTKLGLYEKRHQKVKHYSGGMKRRINLIAGLLHQPQLLILDEPTVGIDVQSKQAILDYLQVLNQHGTTILYTSHMLNEAEQICHQITIMDHGHHIANGTPNHLMQTHGASDLETTFLTLTGKALRDQ